MRPTLQAISDQLRGLPEERLLVLAEVVHYYVKGLAAAGGPQPSEVRMSTPDGRERAEQFQGGPALDLVAYQAGAVVSREIVSTPAGSVTAFAFDAGQGLSEHTAPFDALVHVLDGRVEITIGGAPRILGAGELILMPANVPHALAARTPFKMLLVMIRGHAPAGSP